MLRTLPTGLLVCVLLAILAASLLGLPQSASGQSAAQIQQLMSMSPGERERLMRQMGVSEQALREQKARDAKLEKASK